MVTVGSFLELDRQTVMSFGMLMTAQIMPAFTLIYKGFCSWFGCRGVLCQSIMRAQAASPTFTHVYAALVAILNTKVCPCKKEISSKPLLYIQK